MIPKEKKKKLIQALCLLIWVFLLAIFFAEVEIQIEGPNGWASSLPTWRIENHWLLDIFWGGRPMTGYHAWVFSFMFLIFHLPFFMTGKWSIKLEARAIACLELFWLIEDFVWFVLNPAYGIGKFSPENVLWHKNWILFMPTDYWVFSILSVALFLYSYELIKFRKDCHN
jgi:hypothetical protein